MMATVIALPTRVDLPCSIELRERILSSSSDITLDASGVSMLTTPGLQVLMAAKPYLASDKRVLKIDTPSPEFLACLKDFGTELDALQTEGAAQ
jgi:anti-anti-sigma regulatory factor